MHIVNLTHLFTFTYYLAENTQVLPTATALNVANLFNIAIATDDDCREPTVFVSSIIEPASSAYIFIEGSVLLQFSYLSGVLGSEQGSHRSNTSLWSGDEYILWKTVRNRKTT